MSNKNLLLILAFTFCMGLLAMGLLKCGNNSGGQVPVEVIIRDTVFIPGTVKQVVREVPVVVTMEDSARVDSLLKAYQAQQAYYEGLVGQLETALDDRARALQEARAQITRIELMTRQNVYEDSARTEQYFHRWKIEAEGPILSYAYAIAPICPTFQAPKIRNHRIGAGAAIQSAQGGLRPMYYAAYGYKWGRVGVGYLPPSNPLALPGEVQVSAGIEVPIR